jgi:chromodomain-containing protein
MIKGHEKYKVEHVINHQFQGRARQLQYFLKWKGYPESNNIVPGNQSPKFTPQTSLRTTTANTPCRIKARGKLVKSTHPEPVLLLYVC